MDNNQLTTIWNLINTGGVVAILVVIFWLFLKGHIIPRVIYEELTQHIIDELYAKIMEALRETVREVVNELDMRRERARE